MYALHCSPRQTRWNRAAGFIAIALLSMLLGYLSFAPPAQAAAQTPEDFISAGVEKGVAILNDSTLSADERQQRFRNFLLSITDAKRIAVFTLGSYARN